MINGFASNLWFVKKPTILEAMRYVTLEEAMACLPKESGPIYLGGGGGRTKDVVEWTK